MKASRTILLLEDDPNLGFVLKEHLESHGFSVDLRTNGVDGLSAVAKRRFELCLVDVMMPKKDGFAFVRELRQKDQKTPVIFLTAKSMKEDRIEGLRVGADDYLTKPFSMEELLLRIQAVLRRTSGAEPPAAISATIAFGPYVLNVATHQLTRGATRKKLTSKETQVLELLAAAPNVVVSRHQILESVWHDSGYHTGRSLDVFISRLRKLFPTKSGVEILNVHGEGYRLVVRERKA
jgi:DNA-binding response OmpR family regulator